MIKRKSWGQSDVIMGLDCSLILIQVWGLVRQPQRNLLGIRENNINFNPKMKKEPYCHYTQLYNEIRQGQLDDQSYFSVI